MERYNLLVRSRRININDLRTTARPILEKAILELNTTLRDVGERLRKYGDDYLVQLDESCGNIPAREVFEAADAVLRPFRSQMSSEEAGQYQRELTKIFWGLYQARKGVANEP